jgi:hypothetical protein
MSSVLRDRVNSPGTQARVATVHGGETTCSSRADTLPARNWCSGHRRAALGEFQGKRCYLGRKMALRSKQAQADRWAEETVGMTRGMALLLALSVGACAKATPINTGTDQQAYMIECPGAASAMTGWVLGLASIAQDVNARIGAGPQPTLSIART